MSNQPNYALFNAPSAPLLRIALVLLASIASAAATSPSALASPPPASLEEGFGAASAVGAAEEAASETQSKEPPASAELTTAEKITALLALDSDEDMYGSADRCISRRQVERYQVLDSNLLLIHGRRGKNWVNQFPRKCIGLRRNMALIMEVRGAQVCANDIFYARQQWERMDNLGVRGTPLGSVSCVFSEFQQVSDEQVDMIREAAKNGAFR